MPDKSFIFKDKNTSANGFSFILNPEENGSRTIFAPGDTVRLKLYPGGRFPFLSTTLGTAAPVSENITETITEFLVFNNSRKINAGYPVERILSAVWQGTGEGMPSYSGRTVTLASEQTGVMLVVYETSCDYLDISCPDASYVIVTAAADNLYGSYVIDFTEGFDTGLFNRTVVLTIRDACTKEVIPDAHVYINEKYAGRSSSSGLVYLGSMKTGTYKLLVRKEGYKDTDSDNVCNDFFTVG